MRRSILCASSVVFFASGQHAGHQDTQQYAGKYMGGSDSGFQKYMNQYAGQYVEGAQSGGDYQKYTKQYAGNYMQGGDGGYQKYMKQYAGKYMQGDGQAGGNMKQYADKYTQGGDAGYQKYMKQYAKEYSQGGGQAGGDDPKNERKPAVKRARAGDLTAGIGKDQQRKGTAAKSGVELLALSQARTGDVASSAHNTHAEGEPAERDAVTQRSAWKAYGSQGTPLNYGGDRMPVVHNTSDPKEWRDAFLNKYAAQYQQHDAQAKDIHKKFADAPQVAAACHNMTALKKWRDSQRAHIAAFIPKSFQEFAKDALASEYNTNKARIIAEEKLAGGNKTKAPAKQPRAPEAKPSAQAVERPTERATQKADKAAEQPADQAPHQVVQEPTTNAGEPAASERPVKRQQASTDKPAVEAASSKAALSSASLASAVPAAAPGTAPMLLIFAAFAVPIGGAVALFTVRGRRYQPPDDADTGYFIQP